MAGAVPGIYTAFLSGKYGNNSIAMLLFSRGRIAGADAFDMQFDGSFAEHGSGEIAVDVEVQAPPNVPLLQGGMTGQAGDHFTIHAELPADFSTTDYVSLTTPRGPINARIRKVRGLDE